MRSGLVAHDDLLLNARLRTGALSDRVQAAKIMTVQGEKCDVVVDVDGHSVYILAQLPVVAE